MERKSIGNFIAILRKANGLTQRELADKLGVSDKAVSRWERDETAPDLYLIPVIAEIFGVTSDELLRGERAGESAPPPEKQNEKTERQIKTVLKTVRTKFLTKTLICALIAVVGLLAAMLCNFAFYKAELAFFIGFIFFTVAVVMEIVFAVLAFSGLDAEEFEGTHLTETRKYIFKKAETLVFLAFGLFAFTLPLPIIASQTSYTDVSVNFGTWLFYGILFAALAALVCLFANITADKIAEKKGIYTVDKETVHRRSLAKFRFVSPLPGLAKVFLPIIAVTIVLHIVCLNVFDSQFFLRDKGTVWQNADAFVKYMETPLYDNGEPYDDDNHIYSTITVWVYDVKGPVKLQFKWKNYYVEKYEISGTDGKVVYYNDKTEIYDYWEDISNNNNEDMNDDKEETSNDTVIYDIPNFYAKTYTMQETYEAYDWATDVCACFVLAYFAEGITLAVIYAVKVIKNFKKTNEIQATEG